MKDRPILNKHDKIYRLYRESNIFVSSLYVHKSIEVRRHAIWLAAMGLRETLIITGKRLGINNDKERKDD